MSEKTDSTVIILCQMALAKAATNLTSLAMSLPPEVLEAAHASGQRFWIDERPEGVPEYRQKFLLAVLELFKEEAQEARMAAAIAKAGGITPGNSSLN